MGGIVFLVGAGPGDPGLLTLRGKELIENADVLVYDYLASPALLKLANTNARTIYVGKSGSDHTLTQDGINELLVREAKAGNRVVRLKGGDPYIFGRGGEEAMVLREHKIPFEVVPGISSTVAAANYAGIPLTHRDRSSQVVFITGHEKPSKETSAHDWGALAKIGTLVSVMGAGHLEGICEQLIKNGKDEKTPAAMIEWGATPRQRVVCGTLRTLPEAVKAKGLGAPSLLVVGDVVELRESLNWFEERPLFGKKIMVTRTREQASQLARLLKEAGAWVVERPLISIEAIKPNSSLISALERIRDYSHLVLTSPNGAKLFMEALFSQGMDSRILYRVRIAVMGPGTKEALSSYGIEADIVPKRFIAEELLESFKSEAPGALLLARAMDARDVLPEGLRSLGFEVELVPLYLTKNIELCQDDKDILENPPHLVTLTSASTARGLAALVESSRRGDFPCVSIGPITTKEAQSAGFTVVAEAKKSTIPDLAEAVIQYLS